MTSSRSTSGRRPRFLESLRADAYYPSLGAIDWAPFAARGYRLVLLDIDNTLAVHGRSESRRYAETQVARVREAGLEPVLLSNAMADRAASFAASLDLDVIGQAMKPSPKGVEAAMTQYAVTPDRTILVGDQLFTDIMAGRRAEVFTIRVDPIDPQEPWWIRLKRLGETILRRPLGYTRHYDRLRESP